MTPAELCKKYQPQLRREAQAAFREDISRMCATILSMRLAESWGSMGGFRRSIALSPQRRSDICRQAVNARWARAKRQGGPDHGHDVQTQG